MIYYRIAFQAQQSPTWTWKSTVLTELAAVFGFLRLYRALPPDRLRVFSSLEEALNEAKEDLNEQLACENAGLASQSVTAARFLQERKISLGEVTGATSEQTAAERRALVSVAGSRGQWVQQSSTRECLSDENRGVRWSGDEPKWNVAQAGTMTLSIPSCPPRPCHRPWRGYDCLAKCNEEK